VAPHLAQSGREIQVRADGGVLLTARIARIPFYDPEGSRQKIGDGEREPAGIACGRDAHVEARV
jgi:hypothetical protein